MKTLTAIVTATFLLSTAPSVAQSVLWQKLLPGIGANGFDTTEAGVDVVGLPGGDLLVLGEYGTNVTPFDSAHGVDLVRIGLDGTIRWQKRLPNEGRVIPVALFDEQGGSYAIVGWREVSPTVEGDEHLWIGRVDSSGAVIVENTFTEFPFRADRATQARGGGFAVSGISAGRAGVARVDAAFSPPWFRTYDLGSEPLVTAIEVGEESGYHLVVNTIDGDLVIPHVIRLDDLGDTLWTLTHIASVWEAWYDVVPMSDDGFIVAGARGSDRFGRMTITAFDTMRRQAWRIDEPIWIRETDSLGINVPNRIESIGFGKSMVVGRSGPDNTIPLLLEVDQNGAITWRLFVGGLEFSESDARAIHPLGDGGAIVVGEKYRNMLITRVSRLGTTGVEESGEAFKTLDLSFDDDAAD